MGSSRSTGRVGRAVRIGAVPVAVALAVTGCSAAEKVSAKQAVTDGLSALESAETARFTLSLDSSAADLRALDAADADRSEPLTDEQVGWLLGGDVVVAVSAPEGETLGSLATPPATPLDLPAQLRDPQALAAALERNPAFSVAVRLDDGELVELRSVGTKVFARADVDRVAELAGADTTELDAMVAELPATLDPVRKLVDGEWIGVDLVDAAGVADSFGLLDQLDAAGIEGTETVDPEAASGMLGSLRQAFDENVSITEVGESDERGTAYRLTAPARQVADALADDLVALGGAGSEREVREGVASVPDRDISVVVHVKDGAVTAVSLDLTQFSAEPVDAQVALDVDVELDGDPVTAPETVNELDISAALVGLGGMAMLG